MNSSTDGIRGTGEWTADRACRIGSDDGRHRSPGADDEHHDPNSHNQDIEETLENVQWRVPPSPPRSDAEECDAPEDAKFVSHGF